MTFRHRLPQRRSVETIAFEHDGQRYKASIGRELLCDGSCGAKPRLGPIAEIFCNAQKVNTQADSLVHDGAILMSKALQYGCPPADIYHAMKRNPDETMASPLGRAAAYLVEGDKP